MMRLRTVCTAYLLRTRQICRDHLLIGLGLLWLIGVLCILAAPSPAFGVGVADASAQPATAAGSAWVIPDQAQVYRWTTIQLVYQVGSGGMAEGAGVQVQFPKNWHKWVGGPLGPQTDSPTEPYYVTAQASRPGVTLAITTTRTGIDGRTDWLDWIATLSVTGGSLAVGDLITYTFGDRTQGGAGVQPDVVAMTGAVRVAEDPEADGVFVELSDPPPLTTVAREPVLLSVHLPSQATPGTPLRLYLAAQDWVTNPAPAYAGTVTFRSTDPLAELPGPYTFTPVDGGYHTFSVTLHSTGTHWITVTDTLFEPADWTSNPVRCTSDEPDLKIYWGDPHSHTEFSRDGVGFLTPILIRMRDQLGLDFYAATDHIEYPNEGLSLAEWQATRQEIEPFYLPGTFVPILGYEWSAPSPFGHHNVYFQGSDGPLCYEDDCTTLEELWDRLDGEMALTIPHHTGIRWPPGEHTADWTYNNPTYRTSIEIYSGHGQSELYDPEHPLSYENLRPGMAESVDGPHYARDAWAAGHKIGVLAGSDNHNALPGIPWNGLTAVYADSLSRESVFSAIRARHTYATTGERILLDFRLQEAMMGDVVRLQPSTGPVLAVHVVGTAAVDWVELVRYDGVGYTSVFSATAEAGDDPRVVEFTFADSPSPRDSLYFVRMQQPDPNKPGRPAMAWSSPIWVEKGPLLYLPVVYSRHD